MNDLYVVPVSGGKDSQLALARAVDQYGPARVIGVHHFTGIDHPLTYEHMEYMKGRYAVRIEHTSNRKYKDMWDLLDKKNMIPGRLARFCTDEFKIKAFNQWLDQRKDLDRLVVLMGMRSKESRKRYERYEGISPDDEFSLRDLMPRANKVPKRLQGVRVRLPIIDLSTPAVFSELRERGDQINPLYERGHRRVGCYPCILAGPTDFTLAARDPVGREHIITLRDFKAVLSEAKKEKLSPEALLPHNLDAILDRADTDPFGFYSEDEDDAGGCGWCAQ